jgi:hypothetical protein
MARAASLPLMQQTIWQARLPLEIRLAPSECRIFDKADAYLVRLNLADRHRDSRANAGLGCMASAFLLALAASPTSCILLSPPYR